MYKILVVDDEPEIVDSIYETLIDHAFKDVEIIRSYTSRDALSCLNTTKIDILLTDIRMPFMNGIELASHAKSNWPKCRTIFLTGHNEFDYAYSAIKESCDDYILKTESDDEIIRSVVNSITKLDQSLLDEKLISKAKSQIESVKLLLQRKFIIDILEGYIDSAEITRDKFDELNISLNIDANVYIVIGRIDDDSVLYENENSKINYLSALKQLVQESLERFSSKICFECDSNSFVYIISDELYNSPKKSETDADNIAIIKGSLENIQEIFYRTLSATASFFYNTIPVDWGNLHGKYKNLLKIVNYGSTIGREAILSDMSFSVGAPENIAVFEKNNIKNESLNIRNIETLTNFLERGQKVEYFQYLDRMTDGLIKVQSKNNPFAQEIYFTIISCILSYINRWSLMETIAFKLGIHKLTRIDLHDSWKDALEYIRTISSEIFKIQDDDNNKKTNNSIKYIQQYILNHLDEDLNLSKLSEMVYFNPSYFSRLFKSMTGLTLSEYIMETRINKAKELLTETNDKINEISKKIGIQSPVYFARCFRKYTDLSPQEYRELRYK